MATQPKSKDEQPAEAEIDDAVVESDEADDVVETDDQVDDDESDADDESEDPAVAAKAAKAAAESAKAKAKQQRSAKKRELHKDPTVRAMLKAAADEAAKAAREKLEAEAARAEMTESERLKAELAEERAAAAATKAELEQARVDRDFATAISELDGVKIQPKAHRTVRGLVAEAMTDDPELTASEALSAVLTEHDYYLVRPEKTDATSGELTQKKANTTKTRRDAVEAPAKREKTVDANVMSAQEFKEHKARLGIH